MYLQRRGRLPLVADMCRFNGINYLRHGSIVWMNKWYICQNGYFVELPHLVDYKNRTIESKFNDDGSGTWPEFVPEKSIRNAVHYIAPDATYVTSNSSIMCVKENSELFCKYTPYLVPEHIIPFKNSLYGINNGFLLKYVDSLWMPVQEFDSKVVHPWTSVDVFLAFTPKSIYR